MIGFVSIEGSRLETSPLNLQWIFGFYFNPMASTFEIYTIVSNPLSQGTNYSCGEIRHQNASKPDNNARRSSFFRGMIKDATLVHEGKDCIFHLSP